jgi:hypothetical protein
MNRQHDKSRPKAALSFDAASQLPTQTLVVIDDDLAPVVIDIPVAIALFNDNRVAIAVIAPLANHFALADDIAVTMAFADRHTTRTNAHADFFRACRQPGPDKGSGRYNSKA